MAITGVLFDKDGTLFDFHATWASWAHDLILGLAAGNAGRAADAAGALGYDLENRAFLADSLSIAGTVAEQARALVRVLPGWTEAGLEAHLAAAAEHARGVPPVPLAPLLDGLRARGLRLGVATNDAEAAARAQLRVAAIADRFDYLAGYDSGFGPKPGAGMCRGFSERTGLAPDEVVMVGDSTHDLTAGRTAGMRTVAVLTGLAGAAELAPFADAVLPDIGALPAWLDRAEA